MTRRVVASDSAAVPGSPEFRVAGVALAGLELVLLEMGYPAEPGSAVTAAQCVFAQAVKVPYTVPVKTVNLLSGVATW